MQKLSKLMHGTIDQLVLKLILESIQGKLKVK